MDCLDRLMRTPATLESRSQEKRHDLEVWPEPNESIRRGSMAEDRSLVRLHCVDVQIP